MPDTLRRFHLRRVAKRDGAEPEAVRRVDEMIRYAKQVKRIAAEKEFLDAKQARRVAGPVRGS